jgi:hypothetical protein
MMKGNNPWKFPSPAIFPPKVLFGGKIITVRTSGSPNRQAFVKVIEYPGRTVEDSTPYHFLSTSAS